MRLVFFGTPPFAVPTLDRLTDDPSFEVTLVVTQPDRPAGRGRRIERSAVAEAAHARGLPLYQPASLRDPASRQPLAEQAADLFVVAAFGLIFGPKTLALPRLGCVNVHASLLPRLRGAAPIVVAVVAGDDQTGVSLMLMDPGLDTGPILAAVAEPVRPDDTAGSLGDRLAHLGADLAAAALPRFAAGVLPPTPQPSLGATLTRPLTKADGWLDWEQPALDLERRIRAMLPWPRAWTTLGRETLQVHAARVVAGETGHPPGTIVGAGPRLIVACSRDALELLEVQPAGGRPMTSPSFLAGRRDLPSRLGEVGAPPPQPALAVPVGASPSAVEGSGSPAG